MSSYEAMRRITEVPCECPRCLWDGTTGDCEAREDGELCCPLCFSVVVIDYSEQELNPACTSSTEPT